VADYREANPRCEVCELLNEMNPGGWSEQKRVWKGVYVDGRLGWDILDIHHIRGSREGDATWNLIRACRPSHEFMQSTWVGLLVCLLVKEQKGELRVTLKPNPVGLVCNALENGFYAGRCEAEARDFCRRHGL
jgi:hypothetical protein